MGYPIPFERLLHLSHPQYTLEVTHWLLSVCIFSNFSKVRVPLLEPMQLGNYKLGRQKLLAGLRIGSVPHRFPRDSLGLSKYIFICDKTDWLTKKLIDNGIIYYICVKTTFLVIFFSLMISEGPFVQWLFNVYDVVQKRYFEMELMGW